MSTLRLGGVIVCPVIVELHPEKMSHVWTEHFLDARGHLRCQRYLAVQQIREFAAPHLQETCGLRQTEVEGFDDFGSDQVTWVGWILHPDSRFLVPPSPRLLLAHGHLGDDGGERVQGAGNPSPLGSAVAADWAQHMGLLAHRQVLVAAGMAPLV